MITLFTIGFTKKSAEHFFELLKKYHVKKIIDIRINNTSQLAGFAKGVDLSYFAQQICGIEYTHIIDGFQPFLNSIRLDSILCLFSRSSMLIASAIIIYPLNGNCPLFVFQNIYGSFAFCLLLPQTP